MRIHTRQNTYIELKNEYGKVENQQIFVIARSGWGKNLTCEAFAEEYHRMGYVVIILTDPKDEIEYGYAQFYPEALYHTNALQREGKKPEVKKVKLYHPFTFNIPRKKLPEYNFYTISLKSLGQREWSLLGETQTETETIRVLNRACSDMSDDIGLYEFLHYMQELIKGKRGEKHLKPDPENFYLSVTAGTAKSLQDIANYLHPFKQHYFLERHNHPLNINWRKILNDQEHYHVFVTNFISRKHEKVKAFIALTILNQLVENSEMGSKPILLVIPEIRYLMPFKPKGFKLFLAEGVRDCLSIIRSKGEGGFSSLLDTQSFSDVDETVMNSATITFIGELGGGRDLDKISKSLSYKRETREMLAKMPSRNTYLIQGEEANNAFKTWFPRHMHCEPEYSYIKMFARFLPEKMQYYTQLKTTMRNELKEDERKIRDRIRKQEAREKERQEEIQKLKEEAKQKDQEVKESKEAVKEEKEKVGSKFKEMIYDYKNDNPKLSWRKIAEKFDIHHMTAKKYYEEWEKHIHTDREEPLGVTSLPQGLTTNGDEPNK